MKNKTIYRSSITGKIVTEQFAKDNPNETVKETILNHKLDPIELRVEIMASRQTGINRGNISSTCRGIYETAGGYKWKYL